MSVPTIRGERMLVCEIQFWGIAVQQNLYLLKIYLVYV